MFGYRELGFLAGIVAAMGVGIALDAIPGLAFSAKLAIGFSLGFCLPLIGAAIGAQVSSK